MAGGSKIEQESAADGKIFLGLCESITWMSSSCVH